MTIEQMELFKEAASKCTKSVVKTEHKSVVVEIDGQEYTMTTADIDKLEQQIGRCENEDGVDFFWLCRQLIADGAKRIKLI